MSIRFFILLFFIISNIYGSYAQIIVGPRIGLNLSSINGLSDSKVRPGSVVGGFISYNKSNVGFSADVLISSKGNRTIKKSTTISSTEIWDSYSNLVYIELPLLATVYLNNQEHLFRPKFFAGPSIAYKLSASESMNYRKDETNVDDTSFSTERSTTDKYKKADLGILLGTGFSYHMSSRAYFNFDARYTLGLIDIMKTPLSDPLYNRNIAFYIGIGYQIGK